MHFPPVDPQHPIPADLVIVRYMKISTFLMLINGKVFIPSLKTLQRIDPVEAFIPTRAFSAHPWFHHALHEDEAFQWLCSRAQEIDRDYIEKNKNDKLARSLVLEEIWLRELPVRRCVWCWYAKRPESMAMWNNYGPHGIAIISSIERVRAALPLPDDALTSVGFVTYLDGPWGGDGPDPHDRLTDSLWINRPYYFKHQAYEYEEEVRFVLAGHPDIIATNGGILRNIDASMLIEEVLISPHLHRDEAIELRDVILKACPFLEAHQVTISSLFYPENPSYPKNTAPPDLDTGLRRELYMDSDGKYHFLPKMMLEV
jgi:hypothetical protein